jgi:peptide/nickel transport system substrate-binding protein
MQPRLAGGTSDHAWRALGEGLIFVNQEKKYVPWLAKGWSISADGAVWTFNIQEGVQFHKGRGEMTAEDVLWSMQEMTREDSLQSLKGQIARLWNIEAGGARVVDRYTVEVNSGKVYADMLNTMSRHHINIYSKQATDELGEEEAFDEAVATGAWQKAEIKPGEFWRMSAVEDHWRKAPEFAELILWHMPEESTRVANFQVGKLDTFEMALDSLPAVAQEPGTKFMRVPGATGLALSWFGNWYVGHGTENQRPGYDPDLPWVSSSPDINSDAWKDAAKVRRAMSIAINRQEIVDTILAGEGQPAVMVGWGGAAHRLPEDIRSWEFDPELAKQLLAEAGYADGFSITLQAPPLGIPSAFEATQAVATMWENIGISARAEQEAYATIRPTVIDRSFNQAYLNGGSGRPDPLDLWPEIFPSTAGFTLGVSHPVLDDLMSQAVQIPDPIERDVVMVEAARFVYENTLLSAVYSVNRIWPLGPEIDSWLEHVDYSTPASLTSTQWITHRK